MLNFILVYSWGPGLLRASHTQMAALCAGVGVLTRHRLKLVNRLASLSLLRCILVGLREEDLGQRCQVDVLKRETAQVRLTGFALKSRAFFI